MVLEVRFLYGCEHIQHKPTGFLLVRPRESKRGRLKAATSLHCSHGTGAPYLASVPRHRSHFVPSKAAIKLQYSQAIGYKIKRDQSDMGHHLADYQSEFSPIAVTLFTNGLAFAVVLVEISSAMGALHFHLSVQAAL